MIKKIAQLFLSILIILFLCLLFIFYSSTALRWSLNLARTVTHQQFNFNSVQGYLAGTVKIDQLSYTTPSISIDVKQLQLALNPWKLFRRQINIIHLSVNTLTLSQRKTESNDSIWHLPLDLKIKQAALTHFKYVYEDQLSLHANGLSLQGALSNREHQLSGFVQLHPFTGSFNQQKFSAALNLQFSPQQFQIHQAYLNMGDAKAEAHGGFNQVWNLSWNIHIPDLKQCFNSASGTLNSQGKISGTMAAPVLRAVLAANSLHLGDLIAQRLDAQMDLQNRNTLHAKFQGTALNYQGWHFEQINVHTQGSLAANQTSLTAKQNNINIAARITGAWNQDRWSGQLTALNVSGVLNHQWQLEKPSALELSSTQQVLNQTCLKNQNQTACFSFENNRQWMKAHSQLKNISLDTLLTWLQPDPALSVHSSSFINSDFSYTVPKDHSQDPALEFKVTVSPGRLTFKSQGTSRVTASGQSEIVGSLKQNRLTLSSSVILDQQNVLQAHLNISNFNQAASRQALSGTLRVDASRLTFIPILIPAVQQITGALRGQLNFAGTVEHPSITGAIKLAQGQIRIPDLGITLTNVLFHLQGNAAGILGIEAQAQSGSGRLILKSQFDLNHLALPFSATLNGQNVLVYKTRDYQIIASPNLKITRSDQHFNINGTILIPSAVIAPMNLGDRSHTLSRDVIFDSDQPSKNLISYQGNINLVLGHHIILIVKGLTGFLTGQLAIQLNSNTLTTAAGTLAVKNGNYTVSGQSLQITTGKLIYTGGSILNPGLDIIGSKTVTTSAPASTDNLNAHINLPSSFGQSRTVTVGVNVLGTLNHYKVSLFSDPAIYSQSDILALMLTGQSTDDVSNNNAQLLLKAASALDLDQHNVSSIQQRLQQLFGLDELGIGSTSYENNGTEAQTTSLTFGKNIARRAFISYSLGLLTPVNIFSATYKFTKSWSLQVSASTLGTGTDVFYTIEK